MLHLVCFTCCASPAQPEVSCPDLSACISPHTRSPFPLGGKMRCERQSRERQATTAQLQRMQLCQCQILPRPLSLTPLERRFATVTAHIFVFMLLTNSLTVEGATEAPRAGVPNAARLLSARTGRCQPQFLIIFQLPRLSCSVLSSVSCPLSQFLQAFPKGGSLDHTICLVGSKLTSET